MQTIDLVVSCYNESEVLDIFYSETKKVIDQIKDYNFNFIFIDDGSTDNTLDILLRFAQSDKRVKYISFSRNFGKESAMYAGLKSSTGDYVLIMDSDMQNPPYLIPQMIEGILEGYDCCSANRRTRVGEPKLKIFFARRFYKLTNKISDVNMPDGAGDFRLMNRKMVNAILAMSEVQRFSKGIFSWVGFKTKWIYFDNVDRAAGTTKWSFWKLFSYAIDGITAFSTIPLRFVAFMGVFVSSVSFLYFFYILIKTIVFGVELEGYASTICFLLFIGGIIILCLGIIGEYIAKIYMEVKNRPIYIVRDTNIKS